MLRKLTYDFILIPKRFAGHSKWANIRHIKGTKDAERNILFTKLSRQIKVAITEGGSIDPKKNLQLSQVIDQCKRFNMATATLQNILKNCTNDKSNAKTHIVDIKGPGNCMIICEIYTNNLHHIKQLIATHLKKHKSKFIEGSALHMFEKKGIIEAENPGLPLKNEELLELAMEHAIESNSEEVNHLEEKIVQFLCSTQNFSDTQNQLEKLGYTILNASINYIPLQMQELGNDDLQLYEKLKKKLNEMPEVEEIFDNVNSTS